MTETNDDFSKRASGVCIHWRNSVPPQMISLLSEALDRLADADVKARLYEKIKHRERGAPCLCRIEDDEIVNWCALHKEIADECERLRGEVERLRKRRSHGGSISRGALGHDR